VVYRVKAAAKAEVTHRDADCRGRYRLPQPLNSGLSESIQVDGIELAVVDSNKRFKTT